MRTRLAWFFAVISLLCVVVDTTITAAYEPLLSEASIAHHGWPFVEGAAVCSAAMGALIVSRYPRHPVGWLLTIAGTATSLSLLGESYSIWQVDEGGPGPAWAGDAAGWVSALLGGQFSIPLLAIMFLLVPDGRLLARAWRYVMAGAVVALGLFLVGLLDVPAAVYAGRGSDDGAGGLAVVLLSASVILSSSALIAAVVCMGLRLRRARGEPRQQLRWIVSSASLVGVGLVVLIVGQGLNGGHQTWLTSLPLFVAYLCLPLGVGVAVLRYRLYDIDVIISRAVVLTIGSVFVAGGYVALVVGVGGLLRGWTRGFWPSLIATALVAVAFQPLRRRVVRFADRLVYGRRAVPYDALAEFSRRLGRRAATASVLPTVAQVVGEAVHAKSVTVEFRTDGAASRTARWSPSNAGRTARSPSAEASRSTVVAISVADHAGVLGAIEVTMPPGRNLRRHDRRLLQDITDQAAVALRNTQLETELAHNVELLDRRAEELEASRRRLILAADAERRRLEAAISREVLPSLGRVQAMLAHLEERGWSDPLLDDAVDEATRALDALRQLSHGVFPTLLGRAGLGPALSAHFARLGPSAVLVLDPALRGRRFPARVEAAAFFCAIESAAGPADVVRVGVTVRDDHLDIEIVAAPDPDRDDQAILDRVDAVGGTLTYPDPSLTSTGGLRVRLPIERLHPAQVAAQADDVASVHA